MIIVIKLKLFIFVDSSLQKLAVYLFFRFDFIKYSHCPAIDDKYWILWKCEQKSCLAYGILTQANDFFTKKIMTGDIYAWSISCLPNSYTIIRVICDYFVCFLLSNFRTKIYWLMRRSWVIIRERHFSWSPLIDGII